MFDYDGNDDVETLQRDATCHFLSVFFFCKNENK